MICNGCHRLRAVESKDAAFQTALLILQQGVGACCPGKGGKGEGDGEVPRGADLSFKKAAFAPRAFGSTGGMQSHEGRSGHSTKHDYSP